MSQPSETLLARIAQGAKELSIVLSATQLQQLEAYVQLLIKWNKTYNLTAIRDPQQMVDLHILDSLAIHPHIQPEARLIDVGTGAGLPGIVLAIMNPEQAITLLDSNGKKTRFLVQAKAALTLNNLSIQNLRVEQYQPELGFDLVVSRAFASLADMTQWCQHLLNDTGAFIAMKGQYPAEELSAIEEHYRLEKSTPLHIPGVVGERHLLHIVPLNRPNERI